MEVLDIYSDAGTIHDFKMFKESLVGVLPEDILAMFDSGYQGVNEHLSNAMIPYKATKKKPLTVEEKNLTIYVLYVDWLKNKKDDHKYAQNRKYATNNARTRDIRRNHITTSHAKD